MHNIINIILAPFAWCIISVKLTFQCDKIHVSVSLKTEVMFYNIVTRRRTCMKLNHLS